MEYLILTFSTLLITIQSAPVLNLLDDQQSRNVPPETLGGHYEGDIVFPEVLTARDAIVRRQIIPWPDGIIPYKIASSIEASHSLLIVQTMRTMEDATKTNKRSCITFRPKIPSDMRYITIKNGTGCSAPVGVWNFTPNQTVTLMHTKHNTCMMSGLIEHELTHVLGFYHEQSRPDRDLYVSIQWENIRPGYETQFNKMTVDSARILTTPYDYGSVMHYRRGEFSINGNLSTIIPTYNASAVLGQRTQLSETDILDIQLLYGCLRDANTTAVSRFDTLDETTRMTNAADEEFLHRKVNLYLMIALCIIYAEVN